MKAETPTPLLIVLVIAALSFAQAILLPFALAFLLTFLLSPFATRLEKWLGRVASVLVVVLGAVGFFGFFGWIVMSQLFDLAGKLPEYRENIQKKVRVLQPQNNGALSRATEAVEQIQEEIVQESAAADPDSYTPNLFPKAPGKGPLAIPVRVVETPRTSVALLGSLLGPLLVPLGMFLLVMLYVVFMLLQRESLRDRLIRLIGVDRIGATTQGLDDAASRVSRYLLMQLVVNATYGVPLAIGLYLIGVPNALLWGLVATVLRFIPFLGPWLAAVMPVALSIAVFDSWNGPLLTISLYVLLEILSNNVLEPWLYGSSTGVSSLAIIMAGVFWTWLWGVPGMMLATPLTVCLAVLGRHVPQFEFLYVMLSDTSALGPDALVYQRLLVLDNEDATETAVGFLKQGTLEQLHEEVLIPALIMEELDYSKGTIDTGKHAAILQGLREIVEECGDSVQDSTPASVGRTEMSALVCLPAKDEADEIAGLMLSQLAQKAGIRAFNAPVQKLASEMLDLVQQHEAGTVCISVLPPLTISYARYLCKKLRLRFPELRIVVGLWNSAASASSRDRLTSAGANAVVTKLSEVLAQIH